MAGWRLQASRPPFGPLKHFLRLDAQRCKGQYFKTLEANFLAGHLTVAVAAVLDSPQRFLDQRYLAPLSFQFFKFDMYFSLGRSDIAKIRRAKPVVLEFVSG